MIRRRDRGRSKRVQEKRLPDGRLAIYLPGDDISGNTEAWVAGPGIDVEDCR